MPSFEALLCFAPSEVIQLPQLHIHGVSEKSIIFLSNLNPPGGDSQRQIPAKRLYAIDANMITDKNIETFISYFKGREDIYAVRWEKSGSSGYMPSYDVDWNAYKKHKAKGGTFKNFKNKKLVPLSETVFIEHLTEEKTIGIYPLLEDNYSCLIAVDFDGKNWAKDSVSFIEICDKFKIPSCLERSRSGNGGHVWIFFEGKYLASKSRKIVYELLRRAQVTSEFDKDGSFDRVFPNQDFHRGLGFGNLIALPLNYKSLQKGNTCFLDSKTLYPYDDQWGFLESQEKVSLSQLDELFERLFDSKNGDEEKTNQRTTKRFEIIISNQIYLEKDQIPFILKEFIRENLNFMNLDYLIRKRMGRSVHDIEAFFKLIEETENRVVIPRGFISTLVTFCKGNKIDFILRDRRKKGDLINYNCNINLYPYQEKAIEITNTKDFGVIVSPPGTGKTIMSLEIINRKQQRSLIVVHRKQLLDQWIDRIQSFLGIPKHKIGIIASGKRKIGEKITVAMIQSLRKKIDDKIESRFGIIIIDECHHIPAKTFRETITVSTQ